MKKRSGPCGIHLFDRRTGLNILMDEAVESTAHWSSAPRYVSISLTNTCELACPFCYASKKTAKLDFDTVVEWAKALDQAGCFGIGFGGGEPTLFPRFDALCRSIRAETDLAITFTTHGHRLTDELATALAGSVDFIRLSMDGIEGTYERLRGRSFDQFKRKMAIARDLAQFGINYVVNSDTIGDLAAAAHFVFDEGAHEILLLPEIRPDGTLAIDAEVLARLQSWVETNHERYRLATSTHSADVIGGPILPISALDESYEFMHINASGKLKLTAFSAHGVGLAEHDDIIEQMIRLRALSAEASSNTGARQ